MFSTTLTATWNTATAKFVPPEDFITERNEKAANMILERKAATIAAVPVDNNNTYVRAFSDEAAAEEFRDFMNALVTKYSCPTVTWAIGTA